MVLTHHRDVEALIFTGLPRSARDADIAIKTETKVKHSPSQTISPRRIDKLFFFREGKLRLHKVSGCTKSRDRAAMTRGVNAFVFTTPFNVANR